VAERGRGSRRGLEELLFVDFSLAASLRRERQMTVPDPTRSPSCQPSSMGPPDSTMAGMSTVDAAMICAGVVLSQPVVSTTASMG
jgi:hypothetical protein